MYFIEIIVIQKLFFYKVCCYIWEFLQKWNAQELQEWKVIL